MTELAPITKLPARPTMANLADAIEELHNCVHELREEVSSNLREHKLETKSVLDDILAKVEHIAEHQATFQEAFGIGANAATGKTKGKPLAMMSQYEATWKLIATIASVGTAVFFIWKFVAFAAPEIWHFLVAMNTFVTH